MSKPRRPSVKVVTDGEAGLHLAMGRLLGLAKRLEGQPSPFDADFDVAAFLGRIAHDVEVAAMPFDAFDVVESMRMREYPLSLLGFKEQESDGLAVAVELAVLAVLARGQREPLGKEGENAGEAVPTIHQAAEDLVMLRAAQAASAQGPLEATADPIAALAEAMGGSEFAIRNRQYSSVRDAHDERLFGDPNAESAMRECLGFGYAELVAVRAAIVDLQADRFTAARDALADACASVSPESMTSQQQVEVARLLNDLMFKPGGRSSFRAEDIAARTGLDWAVVEATLSPFTSIFSSQPFVGVLQSYVAGVNPLTGVALIGDGRGEYTPIAGRIGDDSLRAVVETAVMQTTLAQRYVRARTRATEGLVFDYISALTGADRVEQGFVYYTTKGDDPASVLDSRCVSAAAIGKQTEMDVLGLWGDVLLCVEVKGKRLRNESRAGHERKLESDLKSTIGEATEQARRVRELVESNGGVWTPGGWVDLSHVAEIHCIAVTMDDLGPVGISLDELVRAGIVTDPTAPWIVSLHDLAVIARVVTQPAEFLLYLRRRTEPDFAKVYRAIDELDLFMLFVEGQMFLEPDPEKLFAANPTIAKPSKSERRRYHEQLVSTHVGTHTDPLDAWMYSVEAGVPDPDPKPTFWVHESFRPLVARIVRHVGSTGVRAVTDLLSLSGDAQERVARQVQEVSDRTAVDGLWHTFATRILSESGTTAVIVGSVPRGFGRAQARGKLDQYADAKSHQTRADSSLRVMVDAFGNIEQCWYRRHPYADDPGLDAAVASMSLQPPDGLLPIPPSARRTTRRLRRKKR